MSTTLAQLRNWLRSSNAGFDTGPLAPSERARYYTCYEAARKRLDGAMQLGAASKSVPALLLFREGFVMLGNARRIAQGAQPGDDGAETLESFIESMEADLRAKASLLRGDLATIFGQSTAVDALDDRERRARVAELSSLAEELLRRMSPRTPQQRRKWRAIRNAGVALTMLVSLAVALSPLFEPENVALHKRTTSSSIALGTSPSAAVDGHAHEERFGFQSDTEPSPWLRIDLGRPYDITRVRIFGRHDCCFDQSVPMGFEISDDGKSFNLVAQKTDAFDQIDPWEINLDSVRARYVRVRRLEKGLLVLAEVQAFGNAAP